MTNTTPVLRAIFDQWTADTQAIPSQEQLRATVQGLVDRIQHVRSTYASLQGLPRRRNREDVARRAAAHKELQVLVPSLRYLRGTLVGEARPWLRFRQHLASNAFAVTTQMLRGEAPGRYESAGRRLSVTPLHQRIAAELLMSMALPYPKGFAACKSVGQWEADLYAQERQQAQAQLTALYTTLAAMPSVQALSEADQALLRRTFNVR